MSSIGPSSTAALAAMAVRAWRTAQAHRLRQGTGGQDEDSLAAGRAAQRLISPGPLASQPVAQRADHAVVLYLGDGGCPQPLEQAVSPAKQIQKPPLPANPRGLHTAPRISQGCSVVSSFREEVTVVQIIGNGMPQVNGTGGRLWPAVECGRRVLDLSWNRPGHRPEPIAPGCGSRSHRCLRFTSLRPATRPLDRNDGMVAVRSMFRNPHPPATRRASRRSESRRQSGGGPPPRDSAGRRRGTVDGWRHLDSCS